MVTPLHACSDIERRWKYSSNLFETGRRWVVHSIIQALYHEKHPVPIVQKAGWVLGPVWIAPKISPPAGVDLRTVQTVERRYND